MFSFFYNILATFSGGRKFEQLSHYHLKKVQKTLTGSKFNSIDTQVFALLSQRKKDESFFAYIKRRKKLNALNDEDKQTLINIEKKLRNQAENKKGRMLQKYLSGNLSSQNQVQKSVDTVLNKKLSASDANIFDGFIQRQEHESWLTHLKRSKQLYRLPVEEKQKLVNQEKQRQRSEQSQKDDILRKYLEPASYEKIDEVKKQQVKQVEKTLTSKKGLGR